MKTFDVLDLLVEDFSLFDLIAINLSEIKEIINSEIYITIHRDLHVDLYELSYNFSLNKKKNQREFFKTIYGF